MKKSKYSLDYLTIGRLFKKPELKHLSLQAVNALMLMSFVNYTADLENTTIFHFTDAFYNAGKEKGYAIHPYRFSQLVQIVQNSKDWILIQEKSYPIALKKSKLERAEIIEGPSEKVVGITWYVEGKQKRHSAYFLNEKTKKDLCERLIKEQGIPKSKFYYNNERVFKEHSP